MAANLDLPGYLKAQRRLAARLREGASLEIVAPRFLEVVAELFGWRAGALWEPGGGGGLRRLAEWREPDLAAPPGWDTGEPVARAARTGEIAEAADPEAALALPVPVGGPRRLMAVAELRAPSAHTAAPLRSELRGALAGFADQLAAFIAQRRTEAELSAGEVFRAAVLSASLDSIVGMDHDGTVIEFNEAAEALFGYRRDEVVGRELAEVIVPKDLRERHREGLRRFLRTREPRIIDRRVELPAMRRDGTLVPIELTITQLRGSEPPVFTGFLRDLSDRADAERIRQHMAEVVRGTQDAVLSKDLDGIVTSWNPAAERMYGYSAEEAIGRHISFIVPPDRKNEERVILDRVIGGERLETYETERIRADGARIAVSLTVSQITSPLRGVIGASVVARDITVEKRRRRAQEFLVAASRLLDSSLDPSQTARTIVATAVPEMAELCVIDFVREDGRLGDSVVAGADPEAGARLERIRREAPLDPAGEHPVAQVMRSGQPRIWRDLKAPEVIEKVAQNEAHRELIHDAGYNSAAVVPLIARGRALGALSFLHARPDLRYDEADLEFLTELGDRAAMALDNARLYRERDRIAQNLQRGLRPPQPPRVEGLEFSVVFEAAGRGVEVGGDFYDVIPAADGCWVLIGDVAGKGSTAAGVSVAVRHSVRGLTREIDEPAEVLSRVNELLIDGNTLNDFATVQLLRLQRDGGEWRLEMAAAGHPPALHARLDEVAQLGGGTILGAWREAALERHEAALADGETLVLCTDGLLEAGPVDSHRDSAALAQLTGSLAGMELPALTERLRQDALARGGGELRDDLVILALRPGEGQAQRAARTIAGSISRSISR